MDLVSLTYHVSWYQASYTSDVLVQHSEFYSLKIAFFNLVLIPKLISKGLLKALLVLVNHSFGGFQY